MEFVDIDDGRLPGDDSLDRLLDEGENEKRYEPRGNFLALRDRLWRLLKFKWHFPSHRERRWPVPNPVTYTAAAVIVLVAFCLAVQNHRIISSARSDIIALKMEIDNLNMTLSQRVDTFAEEREANHQRLSETLHLDLMQAVQIIDKEFNNKLTELNTTLLSQMGTKHKELGGSLAELRQSMSQIYSIAQNNDDQLTRQVKDLRRSVEHLQNRLG